MGRVPRRRGESPWTSDRTGRRDGRLLAEAGHPARKCDSRNRPPHPLGVRSMTRRNAHAAQHRAWRSLVTGVGASSAFAVASSLLAVLASQFSLPPVFNWPFLAFVMGGLPLSALIDETTLVRVILTKLAPVGGPAAAMAFFLACAWPTWVLVFAAVRYWHLGRATVTPLPPPARSRTSAASPPGSSGAG